MGSTMLCSDMSGIRARLIKVRCQNIIRSIKFFRKVCSIIHANLKAGLIDKGRAIKFRQNSMTVSISLIYRHLQLDNLMIERSCWWILANWDSENSGLREKFLNQSVVASCHAVDKMIDCYTSQTVGSGEHRNVVMGRRVRAASVSPIKKTV